MPYCVGQVKFWENNMLRIGILVPGQGDSTENCRALKYILHLIYSGIPCPKNGSIGYTLGNCIWISHRCHMGYAYISVMVILWPEKCWTWLFDLWRNLCLFVYMSCKFITYIVKKIQWWEFELYSHISWPLQIIECYSVLLKICKLSFHAAFV